MEADIASSNARLATDRLLAGADTLPGAKDSLVLAMDSLLTVVRLFKAEAALAIKNLPLLLAIDVYRIPAHLLTWISFCMLAACAVQALTENLVISVGTFFLLQLGATLLLENQARKLRSKVTFPESRKGLAMAYESIKERFHDEDAA